MKKKRLDDYTSSLCWRKKNLVMRWAYILMVGLVVSTDLGEGARQNGFFGNQVRDVKWRVDENQGSDRSEHSL